MKMKGRFLSRSFLATALTMTFPALAAADEAAAVPAPSAHVHITSPTNVVLYQQPAGTDEWVQACTSPCDKDLPVANLYRISGNGFAPTELRLEPDAKGNVEVAMSPPSTTGTVAGGVLLGVGGVILGLGLLIESNDSCDNAPCTEHRLSSGDRATALGLMGGGLVTVLVGTLVLISSRSTDIVQAHESKPHEPPAPRSSTRWDAFVRTPTWRSEASAAPPARTPFAFGGTF